MNTSKKALKILDILDDASTLISEKATFHTFIMNYDISCMESKYKEYLNDIMQLLGKEFNSVNYIDYLNSRSLNDYFNDTPYLYGLVVVESQDTIYLDVLYDNETTARFMDCIFTFNQLSKYGIEKSKDFKENPKFIKDNTEFFNFAPLS